MMERFWIVIVMIKLALKPQILMKEVLKQEVLKQEVLK
jgi:hypothetical protein